MRAYIGLGGNLGDPAARLVAALRALHAHDAVRVSAVSSLYRSPPMGPADQPHYVNAVAALDTTLTARALLGVLQTLERAAGRTRGAERWQARTLDLDLLLHGALRLESPRLTLPHPGTHLRPFVIHPLAEIAPDEWIPDRGRAADLARRVDAAGLERIAGPPRYAT